jgi:hypothetical protein
MLAPFLLFCLRIDNKKYTASEGISTTTDFGFLVDGKYSLTLHQSSSRVVFGLLSPDELKRAQKLEPNSTLVFLGNESIGEIQSIYTNESKTITGAITKKNVYTIFCYSPFSSSAKLLMSADFSNPTSRLDYRAMPSLVEMPVAIAAFSVVLLFWLGNWFINCNLRIYIHYCLTVTFTLGVIARVISFVNLKHTEVSDTSLTLQSVSVAFRVIFLVAIYTVILLCAKGWCIVRQSVRIVEFVRAITLAVAYIVMQTVLDLVTLASWLKVGLLLLVIICMILYVRELFRSIHLAEMYIMAHLLEISNSGIDPETTPVWQKQRMFNRLQLCVIAYFVAIFVQIAVELFVGDVQWVMTMMQDLADLTILIAIAIVYRLRGGNRHGFTLIEETDDEMYIGLTDFEPMETPRRFQRGGRRWESGMILPPPPGARTNTTISLAAPDGDFQVSARLERPESV